MIARENPLIPMAAVTGKPDREFIRYFMGEYAKVGITQFLVYPRSGCQVEYLSEEWFGVVDNIIEAAQDFGYTSLWLYDEFNWPSGQCNGMVMKADPSYCLQTLTATKDASGEVAIDVVGHDNFPNLLNPGAVEFFIAHTHELYYARYKQYFGSLIKGIFTDEPSPGYLTCGMSGDPSTTMSIAWYPELEDEYFAKTGRVLRDDMKSGLLTGDTSYLEPYHALFGERFRTTFFDKIRTWCDARGILLTGHLMGESGHRARHFSGDPLKASEGFSLPGVDEICTWLRVNMIEWQTLSMCRYAIERRGNGGLAEVFAYGPSDMPVARFRQMIWIMAAFGIDHYLLAVSQFRAHGNIYKSTWYNPMSPTQTWFDQYGTWADDAKVAAEFASKAATGEIEVRYIEECGRLPGLLQAFVRQQRPWRMINLGETPSPSAPAVLDATVDGHFVEERTGQCFETVEAFFAWLDGVVPRKATVRNPDGCLTPDIFVRPYDDGSVLVIDCNDASYERPALTLTAGGVDTTFTMPERGVMTFGGEGGYELGKPFAADVVCGEPAVTDAPWTLSLDRANLFCPEWTVEDAKDDHGADALALVDVNEESVFMVKGQSLKAVVLVRNYGGRPRVWLDGKEVVALNDCTHLPQGLRELYQESEEIVLEPGRHGVRVDGAVPNYPFLPYTFLSGAFVETDRPSDEACTFRTLTAIPETIDIKRLGCETLFNYCGKATVGIEVDVPSSARYVSAVIPGQVCAASMDGVDLGVCCWAPYKWMIPETLRGKKAVLSFTLSIPVGGMFGCKHFQIKSVPNHRKPKQFPCCTIEAVKFLA